MTFPLPQPRVDQLVHDPRGQQRRRTDYCGVCWIGGVPSDAGPTPITKPPEHVMFALPDSLAYAPDRLADAVLTLEIAPYQKSDDQWISDHQVAFSPDPQGRPCSWITVSVRVRGLAPIAFSYRVVAFTHPEAPV